MIVDQLLDISGRLGRGKFWLQSILLWLVLYAIHALIGHQVSSWVVWMVNGAALCILTILCIRRLHDRNYSARWMCLVLIPVVGAIWLAWQLGCRKGVLHDNLWGTNPSKPSGEYFVVQ
ncbi:DUF805 domain-containing protein [Undibacterium sp.]|uniref:DUF805 domain-containing protein n=1 Tax=Undibacterium sp. TaxID=1914977 RepID=UPI003752F263